MARDQLLQVLFLTHRWLLRYPHSCVGGASSRATCPLMEVSQVVQVASMSTYSLGQVEHTRGSAPGYSGLYSPGLYAVSDPPEPGSAQGPGGSIVGENKVCAW